MGLFDAFTGAGTRRGVQQGVAVNNQALGHVVDVANAAKGETWGVAGQALEGGLNALGQGYQTAQQQYGAARDMYNPYATAGLAGLNNYSNALGANGQAGYDQATASFRNSPGYQKQVDDTLDAFARKQSSLGVLSSGNTVQGVTDRASDLADREWTGWLGNQNNLAGIGLQATGQQANITKGLGDLGTSYGNNVAGLYNTDANLKVGGINQYTNAVGGAFANNANQNSNLLLQGGRASDAGNSNLWGALFGAGRLIAGAV